MILKYYPGCSLKGVSREYAEATEAVFGLLGVQMEEVRDWVCCGANVARNTHEQLSVNLPALNLRNSGRGEPSEVLVPCPACYQRLKYAEERQEQVPTDTGKPGQDGPRVRHLVHVMSGEELLDRIKSELIQPLQGLRTVCYYGCLLSRATDLSQGVHEEDPLDMDRILCALGADNAFWSWKTECCGAHLAVTHPEIADSLSTTLLRMAAEAGAEAIVTACPMCQFNLDVVQWRGGAACDKRRTLPIFFLPELVGLALGHAGLTGWMERHMIDPRPLLQSKGLIQ